MIEELKEKIKNTNDPEIKKRLQRVLDFSEEMRDQKKIDQKLLMLEFTI